MYAAYSGEISPCVKSYSGTINRSVMEELVKSEHFISRNPLNGNYVTADLSYVNATGRQHVQKMEHNTTANERWMA